MCACHAYDPGSNPGGRVFYIHPSLGACHVSLWKAPAFTPPGAGIPMSTTEKRANVFTEEGRILQVEYAIKNVANAGTIAGLVCTDGVLVIGIKKGSSTGGHEKIYKVCSNIYCAVSGLFSDCIRVVKQARLKAHDVLEELGVVYPVSTLARIIGEMKQRLTQIGGTRPFGVAMLYIGEEDGKYVMFSTDPSGTVGEWKGKCYGENEDAINTAMKKEFADKTLCLDEATTKMFSILASARELGEKEADIVEVLHFKGAFSTYVGTEHISAILREIQDTQGKTR
ncbi:UNVERIFIED_CONTAM: hypothetical protein PYX00_011840 [Menopon gallinae]|uniref:Proteasome subunit alpha type n=1 Tax=Menopon gallinae TaxID=328185 RepID=A0AAW2H8H5_9NEOP